MNIGISSDFILSYEYSLIEFDLYIFKLDHLKYIK